MYFFHKFQCVSSQRKGLLLGLQALDVEKKRPALRGRARRRYLEVTTGQPLLGSGGAPATTA